MVDEKKLSQEEHRIAGIAKRFIRQASIAAKNFKMFGENHPVLKRAIQNCHELLKSLLIGKDSVTFTFAEGVYLIEDISLKDIDLKTYSLIRVAKECDITSLTFLAGVSEEEVGALLRALSGGPGAIKAEQGINNFLLKRNVQSIKADETFFKKVSKKEEADTKAKSQLADILIVNYLLGKSSISKYDADSLIGEIGSDPKRVGGIISNMAIPHDKSGGGPGGGGGGGGPGGGGGGPGGGGPGSGGGSGGGSGIGGPGGGGPGGGGGIAGEISKNAEGIERARLGIEKIAYYMKSSQQKSDNDIKKDIGNVIMALDPSLRGPVLSSEIKLSDECVDLAKDIIDGFSEEILADLIVADFADRSASAAETRKLIQKLLPTRQKREAMIPVLEKRLLQRGVTKEMCFKLLEERFWSDMSTNEKVAMIRKKEPSYCLEIGIADEIKNLVLQLLNEKNLDLIDDIVNKVLDNLSKEDMLFNIQLMQDFKKVFIVLFQSNAYPYKEKLLQRITRDLKNIKDEDTKLYMIKIFAPSIKSAIENRWHEYLLLFMQAFGYDSMKEEIFSEINLEHLLRNMIYEEMIEKRVVLHLSKEIGDDAKRALCNILISITPDDFDSYHKRYDITSILKDIGEDCESLLVQNLSSEKLDAVKNALEALSEIGTKNAVEPVEKLLTHQNAKIQEHAAITLNHIKKRLQIH